MAVNTCSRLLLIAILALFAAEAHAQIYTWVDDEGVVHYADQPQSDKATTSAIKSSRTDQARAAANLSAAAALNQQQTERFYANRDGVAQPDEVPPEEADQTDELVRKASCASARKKMGQFTQARRLYKLDADGAKAYLSEEETLAARAEVQAKITEFCD